MKSMINLWLDDVRPIPMGFDVWVKTVADAKPYLERGEVRHASLDHDLGACKMCFDRAGVPYTGDPSADWSAWVVHYAGHAAPNCEHVGTGYELCVWMARTGNWPEKMPVVHSANPVGAARMRGVIARYFEPRKK